MAEKYDLFLSYARGDDEPFVRRLYHDLTRDFKVWWDRECMPSRGLTFLQEIRDAIEGCDRLIAVIGPKAVESDYVTSEWQHGLLFAKAVVPIVRLGEHKLLPPELSKLHCPDFRKERPYEEALKELVSILKKPIPALGPLLTMVPALPPHFLLRQEDYKRIRELVLADLQRSTVVASAKQTTGLWGMGGSGKTVLAAALTRATETRRAFLNGIIWLTMGQEGDPLRALRQIGMALEDESEYYLELDAAKDRLPRILADKVCLIVLDDVWQMRQTELLVNALGHRCRLLVTTRNADLLTALGTQLIYLSELDDTDALKLLAGWVDSTTGDLPGEAQEVASECGNLPLALSLCGSLARDGISWSDLRDALKEADLTYVEARLPNYPFPNMFKAIQVSVEFLEREKPKWAEHYRDLAVFPAEEAVPEGAVITLWQYNNPLKKREARKLLANLDRKALLKLQGQEPHRLVTLHDLQHDYLRAMAGEGISALHERLLDAYQEKGTDGWPTGPNDGYFFQYLPYHLQQVGRLNELRDLLLDYGWLESKLGAAVVPGLLSDYDYIPADPDLSLVKGALRLGAHVLSRAPGELPSQLTGRLLAQKSPAIQGLLEGIRRKQKGPWLRPLIPNLIAPGGPLLSNITGLEAEVSALALALSPDGSLAVSSTDGILKVWNLEKAEETLTFSGHKGRVLAVALTTGGLRAFFDSDEGTLKVWDLEKTDEPWSFSDLAEVMAMVFTPDGRRALSASKDGTIKVWDLKNGGSARMIGVHEDEVTAMALTPDGRFAVSASFDGTLKVWDLEQGGQPQSFRHKGQILAVALSKDCRRAVYASDDGTIKTCDLEKGGRPRSLCHSEDGIMLAALTPDCQRAVLASENRTLMLGDLENRCKLWTLSDYDDPVSAVDLTPDGRWAVSAYLNGALKVWDLEQAKRPQKLRSHDSEIIAVALSPDNRRAMSVSYEQVKIWDLENGGKPRTLRHNGNVLAVALTLEGPKIISFHTSDRMLHFWDPEHNKEHRILNGHEKRVTAVALTPDGRRAISASWDQTLKVWDLKNGIEIKTLNGQQAGATAVTLSPDGNWALAGFIDGSLRVWNVENASEKKILSEHKDEISAVTLTPEARRGLSASRDGTLMVCDLEGGGDPKTLSKQEYMVSSVALTPDGLLGVVASMDLINVWDLERAKCLATFAGEGLMNACAVSSDGQTIVAGDELGVVHLLRLEGV